jgi:hypothetical protein
VQELRSTLLFPPAPDYAPFKAGPFRLSIELRPLELQDWIEPDEHMVVSFYGRSSRLAHDSLRYFAYTQPIKQKRQMDVKMFGCWDGEIVKWGGGENLH